jgi:hypothetical protein
MTSHSPVELGANLDAQRPDLVDDGANAADGARRPIESGKKAVSGCHDFAPSKPRDVSTDKGVMIVEQIAPTPVA